MEIEGKKAGSMPFGEKIVMIYQRLLQLRIGTYWPDPEKPPVRGYWIFKQNRRGNEWLLIGVELDNRKTACRVRLLCLLESPAWVLGGFSRGRQVKTRCCQPTSQNT